MPQMAKKKSVKDLSLFEKIDMAMRLAGIKAIEDHREAGAPLVVWKDGEVCYVPADEADVPDVSDIEELEEAEELLKRNRRGWFGILP
jgi:hypothetical protein